MDIAEENRRIEPARAEFSLRFYEWALQDARREWEQDFPFLRRIHSNVASAFFSFVNKLSQNERAIFRDGLVRGAHRTALLLKGEELTGDEKELLERFRLALLANTSDVQDLEGRISAQERRVASQKLRGFLNSKLAAVLGDSRENWGRGVWRYRSTIAGWLFDTYIDTGGKYQLRYHHVLSARDHVPLHPNICFMIWVGVHQTSWAGMRENEIVDAANCLSSLCTHFSAALPRLLAGLSPKQ
jgi:hypothetical protein